MTDLPYWKQRQLLKLGPKPRPKDEKKKDADKKEFYDNQLAQAPEFCEECGAPLIQSAIINPRSVICHIVPKAPKQGCPSVALHPFNRWFGCETCHNFYDNKGCAFIRKMKIFKSLKARLKKFWHLIPNNERKYVPECLQPGPKK